MNTFLHEFTALTPLASGFQQNLSALLLNQSALKRTSLPGSGEASHWMSRFDENTMNNLRSKHQVSTRFDALLLEGLEQFLNQTLINWSSPDCGIILATTKGNIELLQEKYIDRTQIPLHFSAQRIAHKVQAYHAVQVVSNACISGISATLVAQRWIQSKRFKHVLVLGCDVISNFILQGFLSFKALASSSCKPFDVHRQGLNLGEAFAAMVVSTEQVSPYLLKTGLISNDSNHISGPSKTGEELSYCITHCVKKEDGKSFDFISAHGTATPYNDEMESKAIALSGLETVPVFSLKAIYGHTLGAAGLLETILSCGFLERNIIPPSFGYAEHGVSSTIHIPTAWQHKPLTRFIKTGSGFGGCNAALSVEKM